MIPLTINGVPFSIRIDKDLRGEVVNLYYDVTTPPEKVEGGFITDNDTKDEASMLNWLENTFLINVNRNLPNYIGTDDPKTAGQKMRTFMLQLIQDGKLVGEGKKLVLKE